MFIQTRRGLFSAIISISLICLLFIAPTIDARQSSGGATLSLVLASDTIAVGDNVQVSVQVDTAGQAVDGAAAYLNFDPTLLQVVQVVPNTALPIPLQQLIDNQAGTIDLAFGQIGGGYPIGTFTLATLTLNILGTSSDTALTFQSAVPRQTDVTFGGGSVFGGAQDLHLVVEPALLATETLEAPTATLPPAIPAPSDGGVLIDPTLLAYASMDDGAPDWSAAGSWQLELQDYLGRPGSGWRLASTTDATAILTWNHWIDLTNVSGAELSFLSMLTGSNGVGVVQVTTDGSGWSSIGLVPASETLAPVTVDLAPFLGKPIQLRFFWGVVDNAGAAGFWLLDEVKVNSRAQGIVLPTAVPPTEVVPTVEPPTEVVPTEVAPTEVPPAEIPSVPLPTDEASVAS
jgi:hypothetical protein